MPSAVPFRLGGQALRRDDNFYQPVFICHADEGGKGTAASKTTEKHFTAENYNLLKPQTNQ